VARDLGGGSPVAFQLQGYKNNRAIMNATVTRITQAIVGESSLDEALTRIDADVARYAPEIRRLGLS